MGTEAFEGIYWGGAEVRRNRQMLLGSGATCLSINWRNLTRRRRTPLVIAEEFPEDVRVYVDPGITSVESMDQLNELYLDYRRFLAANAGALDLIGAVSLDGFEDWCSRSAKSLTREHQGKVLVDVTAVRSLQALEQLSAQYFRLGLAKEAAAMPQLGGAIRMMLAEGATFHLFSPKPDHLAVLPVTSASTRSWLSGTAYGETVWWDGHVLHRHEAASKAAWRQQYAAQVEQLGFDRAAYLAGDRTTVDGVTLWSWRQLEESVRNRSLLTTSTGISDDGENDPATNGDVDRSGEIVPPPSTIRPPAVIRPTTLLPVLEEAADLDVGRSRATLTRSSGRVCRTCSISAVCPGFQADAACVYHIPVEIRSREDVIATANALLEMQAQRVLFARFAEERMGAADGMVTDEIGKFFKWATALKELTDDRDTFKFNLEAKGQHGIISEIFGATRGAQARSLHYGGVSVDPAEQVVDVLDQT